MPRYGQNQIGRETNGSKGLEFKQGMVKIGYEGIPMVVKNCYSEDQAVVSIGWEGMLRT